MRVGVIIPGGGMPLHAIVDVARESEAAGLHGVWVTEAWRSAFVPLTAIALATERVTVGTYVLNAYGRTPFITAMSAVDLDEASNGRLVLGIGSGNRYTNALYQGVPTERPLTKLKEYVELLQRFVRARPGDVVEYRGEIHSMTACPPQVLPVRPSIPVWLAATFPRMLRVAGRVADGVALGALHAVEYIEEGVKPLVEEAAAEAGREAPPTYAAAMFLSADDDREAARQAARVALCNLYAPKPHPHYDFLLRRQGYESVAETIATEMAAGRREAAARAVPDELLDRLALAGTPDECARRATEYRGVVDELIVMNVGALKYALSEADAADRRLAETFGTLVRVAGSIAAAEDAVRA
jgi:5,10-methylenetetrahydromethanopterin reductase